MDSEFPYIPGAYAAEQKVSLRKPVVDEDRQRSSNLYLYDVASRRALVVVKGLGVMVIRDSGMTNFSPGDVGFHKDVM